ncbi:MAG: LysR family transcriptional regulator [Myxococcota bacterium]
MNTDVQRLAALDLNLFVALDALLEAQNVTRAARRVGVTQPAMSRQLSRLRSVFEDPLLERAGAGMKMTPRARMLRDSVHDGLATLAQTLDVGRDFEPSAPRTFIVAMTDYATSTILPGLTARLHADAPSIALDVRPFESWTAAATALDRGDLDAAIGFGNGVPATLHRTTLLRDGFACAVQPEHPTIQDTLSLETYVRTPHILTSTRGRVRGAVDQALEQLGRSRSVCVVVPHLHAIPAVLGSTNAIATLPVRCRGSMPGLRWFVPPLRVPGFDVVAATHAQPANRTAIAWLRRQLSHAAAISRPS